MDGKTVLSPLITCIASSASTSGNLASRFSLMAVRSCAQTPLNWVGCSTLSPWQCCVCGTMPLNSPFLSMALLEFYDALQTNKAGWRFASLVDSDSCRGEFLVFKQLVHRHRYSWLLSWEFYTPDWTVALKCLYYAWIYQTCFWNI